MNFADIPSGASVFVDANVFVYDFAPDPQYGPPCRELMERIELGDLTGFCSTRELSDVAHRLMTQPNVLLAGELSQQHGLLSGDALIVAIMQANNLTTLASNDTDFDRVPGLNRFGPV